MVMLGILAAAALVPAWQGIRPLLRAIGSHPILLATATTVVLGLGARFVYMSHPLSMDEYAPYFQSQIFAGGEFTGKYPVELLDWLIPLGFQNMFLNVSHTTGEVTSTYLPSFALLMTPFTLLGIPWACNPVLSGVTVIVIHRLAMRLFGNDLELAGLAVLFTLASPVFFADGISYYSMTAHMLANATYALLLLTPTPRRLVAAGVIGSIALTLHNPLPHVLFALPWGIWILVGERRVRNVSWLIAGYLPLSILLGLGWISLAADLAATAAPGETIKRVSASAMFTLPTATVWLARAIGFAKVWLWAVPGLVLLAAFGAWRWRDDRKMQLLMGSAILTLAAYIFVWADQGHGWGYRYFHSAWFVLPLFAAAAFATTNKAPSSAISRLSGDDNLRTFVVAAAVLSLVVGVGHRGLQMREFMTDHLNQLPAYTGSEKHVVFVDAARTFYGHDLIQNDPFLRGNVIRLLSRGPDQNAKVIHQLRPGFQKVYSDRRGEVWSVGPGAP
jgi:hypothetical protein